MAKFVVNVRVRGGGSDDAVRALARSVESLKAALSACGIVNGASCEVEYDSVPEPVPAPAPDPQPAPARVRKGRV